MNANVNLKVFFDNSIAECLSGLGSLFNWLCSENINLLFIFNIFSKVLMRNIELIAFSGSIKFPPIII
jgi:hypothetical protein